jgi:diguanylate cyclase (GGDEF)-like protein/putative nucleotidyltransferase with HDIG domain
MSSDAEQKPMQNVRVLVLDDEETIRKLAHAFLSRAGCIVETAADGRDGLKLLLQRDFDVALVDLRMKDMGGSAFLEEARSIWPWLGIVIVTGHADAESIEHAHRFGVTRVLEKPLSAEDLISNVMEEARGKRQRVEMTASHSLDRIQDQLAIMRRFSETALNASNLEEAFRSLSIGLSRLLPCSAVGVLSQEGEQHVVYLTVVRPVAPEFLDQVESGMLQRLEALRGKSLAQAPLRIPIESAHIDATASPSVGSSFTVPIVMGGEVQGLLTLAASDPDAYRTQDISFLYHAANQLSTVLAALGRLRELSVRDVLTGVYNRRGMEEEYQRAWLLSRRYNIPIGVAVIDIDNFKGLNDTHGHPVGDQIIREFSGLVQKVARATDIVARYGGDEMVVVLPQAGPADAITFGERLLTAVRRHLFCAPALGLSLTSSIGVASSVNLKPSQRTAESLVAAADQALYAAKKGGRNRVCVYQPEAPVAHIPDIAAVPADPDQARADARRRGRVLVVDDDPSVGDILSRILAKHSYEVEVLQSANEAIELLKQKTRQFDVVLTDLNMPEKSGLELLDELRSIDESVIKVVITGHATLDNAITSLRRGAYDFIEKPVVTAQLLAVMERATEYRRLKHENLNYHLHLEDMVRDKSAALRAALDQIRQSYEFTLEAMVALLDARERSTGQHSTRVRQLSVMIARELGLSESEVEDISHGALLHDIGKIAIPDSILLKPGPLTPEERTVMQTHPEIGFRILRSSPYLERACEIVYAHQEHFDGTGYPRNLKGDQIPLGARIFAVIDAYDAMRSDRVYRKALSAEKAVEEIRRNAGTQFDPAVVEVFVRCQPEIEKLGIWETA